LHLALKALRHSEPKAKFFLPPVRAFFRSSLLSIVKGAAGAGNIICHF
jgi:hypothetical protein